MEYKEITDLQELKYTATEQLRERLQREVEKETPDDDLVLTILHILEERDRDKPVVLGPKSEQAWSQYQAKTIARTRKRTSFRGTWLARAASLVLILGLLFAFIPQQATAGSFWKILTTWTDTVFEYVNIGAEKKAPKQYVFKTDNPGLQQVYDTVVEELGITDPVVPQWLPEGYELSFVEVSDSPGKKTVRAYFLNGENEVVLFFNQMKEDRSPQYDKVNSQIVEYECNGVLHYYFLNNEQWLISWINHNLKCSVSVDCPEDVVTQIIRSIY